MLTAIVLVFIIGYLSIVFEPPLKLDKSVPALLMGSLIWAVISIGGVEIVGHDHHTTTMENGLLHHLGKTAEILVFLLGAMAIVELVDLHKGFSVITDFIKTRNKRMLLLVLSIMAFFLSAVLDNLTCTIVVISLLRKIIPEREDRLWFIPFIVIAANAGGAWSPIGDVTTTMLWIGKKVSTEQLILRLFIPSVICLAVPVLIGFLSKRFAGELPPPTEKQLALAGQQKKLLSSKAMLIAGIGGDLAALAARGPVTGVDRDPAVTILAAANVQAVCPGAVLDVQAVDVNCCDLRQFAAWHIDPDRRATGRRTTRVELHEPGPEVIDQLRAAQPDGAVKLAPAATLPESWEQAAELEWISRGGECRQLVCWFGCLASDVGRRRATIVADMNGAVRTLVGRGDERLPLAKELGQYLYEPDAAVLAAGLTATLAAEQELAAITPGIAYLTADHVVADPALACFAVRELLPLDKRRLRAVLRERLIGRLEIKKRGVDVDIEKLRRELRLEGDNMATLVLLPYAGRPTALLAERIVSNSYAQGLE